MERPVSSPGWPTRLLSFFARVLAGVGLLSAALSLMDRLALARDARGRPRFPFVRPAGEGSYQILLFHRVNDELEPYFTGVPVATFRAQARMLARHWNVLPLRELVDLAARGRVPRRGVAITFDDGYRDNYEFAYPVLAELRLPATIFLATGAIETGCPLWHDRVFDAFRRTRAQRLVLGPLNLSMDSSARKSRALDGLLQHLRAQTPEEREVAVCAALRALGLEENRALGDRMLTWAQVGEMRAGGIDFGAHSVTHPILTRIPLEEALREILDSRHQVEKHVGAPVDLFAYPNGSRSDFNEVLKALLRDAGFRAAATTIWGSNPVKGDPFELKRVGAWDADPRASALRLGWYRVSG